MIGLIWAQGARGEIGRAGKMAWHLPEDLAFFSAVTRGHSVIMGRRTWQSLAPKYRPLPGRKNIVISRNPFFDAAGAQVASSLSEALTLAGDSPDSWVWIIGGASIYREAIEFADCAVVTHIDVEVPEADAFAPVVPTNWRVTELPAGAADLRVRLGAAFGAGGVSGAGKLVEQVSTNGMRYRFTLYERPRN